MDHLPCPYCGAPTRDYVTAGEPTREYCPACGAILKEYEELEATAGLWSQDPKDHWWPGRMP